MKTKQDARAGEQAHTPGPWQTSRDAVPAGFVQVTVYAEGSGQRVATAFETEANARLIAAAPELLAACRNLLSVVGADPVAVVLAVREAEKAVAKAKGRS